MARRKKPDLVSQQGRLWVLWADFDWVGARILYLKKNPKLWIPAGLLGHKALEQYLKALLRSYGDKTEWGGPEGHDLGILVCDCARYETYFSGEEGRLSIFHDIYRGWRYPQEVRGPEVSGEVALMGDNHLTDLDETVEKIRPRIRLAELGILPTFQELHESLPEGPPFIQCAREENHTFDRMEKLSKERNLVPTLEQVRRSQFS